MADPQQAEAETAAALLQLAAKKDPEEAIKTNSFAKHSLDFILNAEDGPPPRPAEEASLLALPPLWQVLPADYGTPAYYQPPPLPPSRAPHPLQEGPEFNRNHPYPAMMTMTMMVPMAAESATVAPTPQPEEESPEVLMRRRRQHLRQQRALCFKLLATQRERSSKGSSSSSSPPCSPPFDEEHRARNPKRRASEPYLSLNFEPLTTTPVIGRTTSPIPMLGGHHHHQQHHPSYPSRRSSISSTPSPPPPGPVAKRYTWEAQWPAPTPTPSAPNKRLKRSSSPTEGQPQQGSTERRGGGSHSPTTLIFHQLKVGRGGQVVDDIYSSDGTKVRSTNLVRYS